MSDPWDVFGDDVDDNDDGQAETHSNKRPPTESLALHLTQYFVTRHHRSNLATLRVRIIQRGGGEERAGSTNSNANDKDNSNNDLISWWQAPFARRGFQVAKGDDDEKVYCDVLIVVGEPSPGGDNPSGGDAFETAEDQSLVVPGGLLIFLCMKKPSQNKNNDHITAHFPKYDPEYWHVQAPQYLPNETDNDDDDDDDSMLTWVILTKWPVPIQSQTCPWLSSHYDVYAERKRAAEASIYLSAVEREKRMGAASSSSSLQDLPLSSIQLAVEKLQTYGYCILPGLLNPDQSRHFGQTALQDLHEAADILKRREGVDLLEPRHSTSEPASYRELSMREDLRMDLRHGPRLNQLRGGSNGMGCQPWTVHATTNLSSDHSSSPDRFLRGDPIILEIIRRTMNPVDPALYPGNFGRYNFGGSGPDGSFLDLRTGPVGAIISLPGSADQAIHADTPHLFEIHDCLPAHYINVFTPGCAADPTVGQTALVHGSHRLSYTAKYLADDDDKKTKDSCSSMGWVNHLVRPSLTLGDVLLFDCRILHFGLANTSSLSSSSSSSTKQKPVERPLLYTNCWQHWFNDPKNWDDRRPIFSTEDSA